MVIRMNAFPPCCAEDAKREGESVTPGVSKYDNQRVEMYTSLSMSEYSVYIVHCVDGSYYTGVTNNLERRLSEHNDGMDPCSYTHSRRPVCLVYSEEFGDIEDAIDAEKQIKGWSRKKKEALIQGDLLLLEFHAKRRTPFRLRKERP
jgi:putative endonuclease